MSTPQKSLFCYLGAKNFYNRSKFGKVLTKNKFAQCFWDMVYKQAADLSRAVDVERTRKIICHQTKQTSIDSDKQRIKTRLDMKQATRLWYWSAFVLFVLHHTIRIAFLSFYSNKKLRIHSTFASFITRLQLICSSWTCSCSLLRCAYSTPNVTGPLSCSFPLSSSTLVRCILCVCRFELLMRKTTRLLYAPNGVSLQTLSSLLHSLRPLCDSVMTFCDFWLRNVVRGYKGPCPKSTTLKSFMWISTENVGKTTQFSRDFY